MPIFATNVAVKMPIFATNVAVKMPIFATNKPKHATIVCLSECNKHEEYSFLASLETTQD